MIRTIYEILKHKQVLVPNKLSFILMFINMILLWVSWSLTIYIGLLISVLGLIMFLTALFTIKTLESYEGDLITTGIYSKIRHPMYLGFICWLIGFPLIFDAIFSLIFSFIFICNVLFWRYLEEKELLGRFPTYADYRKKTIF
jgi:protein-S-isoprenylcysteine O-methyltransferase Ste14